MAVSVIGYAPYAYQIGYPPTAAVTTALNLAAVSGGNGGALAAPIAVPGPMLLDELLIRSTDTANARSAEWRLYRDDPANANSLREISGASGTFSFTPGAASNRSSTAAAAPVAVAPGVVWLVIRNTSASQTFGIGSQAAGTMASNTAQTKSIPALAATLDFVAATWSKTTALYGVVLRGRVFGQGTPF